MSRVRLHLPDVFQQILRKMRFVGRPGFWQFILHYICDIPSKQAGFANRFARSFGLQKRQNLSLRPFTAPMLLFRMCNLTVIEFYPIASRLQPFIRLCGLIHDARPSTQPKGNWQRRQPIKLGSSIRLTQKSERPSRQQKQAVLRGRGRLCVVNVFTKAETDAGLPRRGTRQGGRTASLEEAGHNDNATALPNFLCKISIYWAQAKGRAVFICVHLRKQRLP
jgi:hypothetical protein